MINKIVSIIILEWKYFAPIGMLYNILLPINCYIGNNTTKHHSGSMGDNRDLTGVFHQKVPKYYHSMCPHVDPHLSPPTAQQWVSMCIRPICVHLDHLEVLAGIEMV